MKNNQQNAYDLEYNKVFNGTNYEEASARAILKSDIEEATQETPTEKMDRILEIHERWETVNLLIKLMNRELKLNDLAKPEEVRNAMTSLQNSYKSAMEEWRKIQVNTGKK